MTTVKLISTKTGTDNTIPRAFKITVYSAKVENAIGSQPVLSPMADLSWDSSTFASPTLYSFDIQRITHIIHIDGYIEASSSNRRSGGSTMKQSFDDTVLICKYGGSIKVQYGDIYPSGTEATGIVTKMMLTEIAEDQTGESPTKFNLKVDITIGTQR